MQGKLRKRIGSILLCTAMLLTLLPVSALADNGEVTITNAQELARAIANQEDGQTWTIQEGTYNLTQNELDLYKDEQPGSSGQGGWYFPLWANGLTIIGEGDVTITSEVESSNGVWASQDFVSVWGDNITIKNVDILSKKTQNKAIEVMGENFTLSDCELKKVDENGSGSIIFNSTDIGTATLENVTLYSWVSANYSTDGTLNATGVTIDFTDNDYAGYYDSTYGYGWCPGIFNNKNGCNVQVKNEDLTIVVDDDIDLAGQIFTSGLQSGTTVQLTAGEYGLGSGVTVTQPVNIQGAGAAKTVLTGSILYGASGTAEAGEEIFVDGITLKATDSNKHQGLCWNNWNTLEGYTLRVSDCVFDGWEFAMGVNSSARNCQLVVENTQLNNVWCGVNISEGSGNVAKAFDVTQDSTVQYEIQVFSSGDYNAYYDTFDHCQEDAARENPTWDGDSSTGSQVWPAAAKIGNYYYGTISEAIDAAQPYDEITILDGEHVENIQIPENMPLTLAGQSKDAVIKFDVDDKASDGHRNNAVVTSSNKTYYPIVYAQSDLTLKNLTIEGPTSEHHGIDGIYATAGLTMDNVTVQDIRCTADGGEVCGVQYGVGVTVVGSGNVDIQNCEFIKFQKQAISLNTTGTQMSKNNLIQGVGAQGIIAQNGIGIWAGTAQVVGNTIQDLVYNANNEYQYCSLAVYVYSDGTTVTVTGNTLENVDNSFWFDEENGVTAVEEDNHYVGGAFLDGVWCSVESALLYAEDGSVIDLNQDAEGPITLNKSVTINGNGHKITSESTGVTVTADGVVLSNLNVESPDDSLRVDPTVNTITVDGGSYQTTDSAQQGAGSIVIGATNQTIGFGTITVKNAQVLGPIMVLGYKSGALDIAGNTISFNQDIEYGCVGILVYMNDTTAEALAGNGITADTLNKSNNISLPNTLGDYVQLAQAGADGWEFPDRVPASESIARIGGDYFNFLQDAVDVVEDGDIIVLLDDCDETVTISREVAFTLDEGENSFDGTVLADDGLVVREEDGSYVIEEYEPPAIIPDDDDEDTAYGSSSDGEYLANVKMSAGGKVTVYPGWADEGDTVTLTVKPDSGYELSSLTVTDAKGNELKLSTKDGVKYTFIMPSSRVEIKASFASAVQAPQNPFTDVSASDYYYHAVMWAAANGVTGGISATTFGPGTTVTRAQMMTFLWRAHGSPKATGVNPFTDVSANDYYYDAVLWAVSNGITSGPSATTFGPGAPVTRGQAMTFQWRAAGSPASSGSSFSDVDASDYYANAINWAVANGITSGTGSNQFSPDMMVSRAQAVTFLYQELG